MKCVLFQEMFQITIFRKIYAFITVMIFVPNYTVD